MGARPLADGALLAVAAAALLSARGLSAASAVGGGLPLWDCDESWSGFREAIAEWAWRGHPEGMPVDRWPEAGVAPTLSGWASDIVLRGWPIMEVLLDEWTRLAHGGEATSAVRPWVDPEAPEESSPCLLGFVSALAASEDPAVVLRAVQMLGAGGALDLLPSSGWRVRSAWMRQRASHLILAQLGAPSRALFRAPSAADLSTPWRKRQAEAGAAPPEGREWQVAVFGHHVSLTLEPMAALQAAWPDARFRFQARGLHYACRVAPQLCRPSPLVDLARHWLTTVSSHSPAGAAPREALVEALRADFGAGDFGGAGADLGICTAIAAHCVAFREAFSSLRTFHYYSVELLQSTPRAEHHAVLRSLVSLMDQGDVFAANVAAKSAKYRYQTGRLFPLVPSIALYVPAGAAAEAPDEGGGPATVLLYRTAFAAEPAGKVFAAQLRRFLLSRSVPLELVEPSEGVWLDWQDVARHRAVLYVPHDLHLMSFSELCALGVPMFTPGDDYLVPFLAHVFTMYGQLCKETAGQLSTEEARAAQALFPYAPHFDDEAHTAFNTAMGHPGDVLLEQVRYWQLYADVSRSALVRRFDSIPQLVEQLLALRRGEAVESLRAAQEALRAEVLDIYRDALPQLLGPPDLPTPRASPARARGALEPAVWRPAAPLALLVAASAAEPAARLPLHGGEHGGEALLPLEGLFGTCRTGFLGQVGGAEQECRVFAQAAGAAVAAHNGHWCMVYTAECDVDDLNTEEGRTGYRVFVTEAFVHQRK